MLSGKEKLSHLLFFIPVLILIGIFIIFPVVSTISLSFLSSSGKFIFLSNYLNVLTRKEIFNFGGFSSGFPLGAFFHNLLWILIHLPLTTFLGLVLAVILKDIKGGSIIKSVIFLGMITPMIIGGVILRFAFDKNVGIVNAFLTILGVEPKTWTAYPETALFALIFGSVWLWVGFSMILYSAGLGTIPKDYSEAAKIDGATSFNIFFRITLPLLKPITIVIVTMTILWELKIFYIVYVATMGGPGGASNVMALQMYFYGFRQFDFNSAAVVATVLMLLTLLVMVPMLTTSRGER